MVQMEEVNGGYKHGRYKRVWLTSFCIMSNIKVFDLKKGGWDNNNIDSYDTYIDLKKKG